jgi:3-hydroxyisobutyrate dehydrogenase
VRLYLDEARALGLRNELAETVVGVWESTKAEEGADSDFTSIVKMMERAAGVIVGKDT